MLKTLVVGGAGYLGRAVVDEIIDSYDDQLVTVYDNLTYDRAAFVCDEDVRFVRGDVLNVDKLSGLIRKHDKVIWLAAIVGDGACNADRDYAYKVNVDSIRNQIKNLRDTQLTFASTCSVYGSRGDCVLDEDSETAPTDFYSEMKLEVEKLLLENACHPSWCRILRLGTLYGLSTPNARVRNDLVINAFAINAASTWMIEVHGGSQWRSFSHVRDAARVVAGDDLNRYSYNVAFESDTIDNIARKAVACAKHLGITPPPEIVTGDVTDKRSYIVTSYPAREAYPPQHRIEDGIREVMELALSGQIQDMKDPAYNNSQWMQKLKHHHE